MNIKLKSILLFFIFFYSADLCVSGEIAELKWMKLGLDNNIAFPSEEGNYIAVASRNNIYILNTQSGELVAMNKYNGNIHFLNLNETDNSFLYVIDFGRNDTLVKWYFKENIFQKFPILDSTNSYRRYRLNAKDHSLAIIDRQYNLKVFDLNKGGYDNKFDKLNDSYIYDISYYPEGDKFVLIKADKIQIYNNKTIEMVEELSVYNFPQDIVFISNSGRYICKASSGTVQPVVYDINEKKKYLLPEIHEIYTIKFTYDDNYLIASTSNGIIKIDFKLNIIDCKNYFIGSGSRSSIANYKSKIILSGYDEIKVWDEKTCKLIKEYGVNLPLCLDSSGNYAVCIFDSLGFKNIVLFDIDKYKISQEINVSMLNIYRINYLPNTNFYYTLDTSNFIRLYHINKKEAVDSFKITSRDSQLSPDLNYIIYYDSPIITKFTLYSIKEDKVILDKDSFNTCKFSVNSKYLIYTKNLNKDEDELIIFDIERARDIFNIKVKSIIDYVTTSDEVFLIVANENNILSKYDISSGKLVDDVYLKDININYFKILPYDKDSIFGFEYDGKIIWINLNSKEITNVFEKPISPIKHAYISRDRRILFVKYFSNTTLIFKMKIVSNVLDIFKNNHFFTIFPNPASEYIEIRQPSEVLETSECSEVRIYNVLGECVLTTPSLGDTPSEKGNLRVDVSGLPSGVYFVRIGDWTGKFVKTE